MAYGTVNTDIVADSSGGRLAPISSVFRNRIINGAMVIDQRNAGASVTGNDGVYCTDRFSAGASVSSKFTMQQVTDAPTGFNYSLKVTSSSAYTVGTSELFEVRQWIEGYNVADLGYGTASAKTTTLSFWVKSSLTGTFGGVYSNENVNRSYPFTYTISAANTWEQKSITVTGDLTGTWATTNGTGLRVRFSLGAGSTYQGTANAWAGAYYTTATGCTNVVSTNAATWQITGVQLEVGSSATGFEYRQYTTELQYCQRYYQKSFPLGTIPANNTGTNGVALTLKYGGASVEPQCTIPFPVAMRTAPTVTLYNPFSGTAAQWSDSANSSANARALGINEFKLVLDNTDVTLNWNSYADINYAASAEL